MFFSRVQLDPARLRLGEIPNLADVYDGHRFVWQFFGDHEDRERDFIYRIEPTRDGPRFYLVSHRPPKAAEGPWRVESKRYDVNVTAGTALSFSLRANPTKRDHSSDPNDDRKHDVVMAEKRRLTQNGKHVHMPTLVQQTATDWLASRGPNLGFQIDSEGVRAEAYQQWRFGRERGREMKVSSVDFTGMLRVTEPNAFRKALYEGVGPAKGFGFGLLLVRRC